MKTILLWAAIGAALLPSPAMAQHDPANSEWRVCVVGQLTPDDMARGSVGAIGVRISLYCAKLYRGQKNADVDVIVALLEKLRSQQPKEPEMVIEPAKPTPKGDMRF